MSVKPTLQGRPAPRLTKAIGYDPTVVTGDAPDPVDRAIAAVFQVPVAVPGPASDVNAAGTVTDGGGSQTFSTPANANDGDVNTRALRGLFAAGAGTYTTILRTDLGSSLTFESMRVYGNEAGSDPAWTVEVSDDGSSWSAVTSLSRVWTAGYQPPGAVAGLGRSEITFDPVTKRYARITRTNVHAGLQNSGALSVYDWTIGGAAIDYFAWVQGPELNDGDDATYHAVAVAAVDGSILRCMADDDYRLGSVQIRIGCAAAGAETLELYGATLADFSDEVLLGSTGFTATGSYTADEVVITAPATAGLTFYRVTGPDDVRIHTVRLYEPVSDASAVSAALDAHVVDPTDAHDASSISVLDAGGNFTGTNVEAVLAELGSGTLRSISPAQLTAATNDWNPTGLTTAQLIRASTDASRNLTGLAAPTIERPLFLANVGSHDLVLKHEDAASTAANRFACSGAADVTLPSGGVAHLVYDLTTDRWRVLAGGAAVAALDDLTDVDLSTPPTDGQALVWDDGLGAWVAGDVAAGGAGGVETHGAWTNYTPTLTASTTNPTLGSSTITGRYKRLDATTYVVRVKLDITTGGAWNAGSGEWKFSLPSGLTAAGSLPAVGAGHVLDSGTARYAATALVISGTSVIHPIVVGDSTGDRPLKHNNPVTWATGDSVEVEVVVEVTNDGAGSTGAAGQTKAAYDAAASAVGTTPTSMTDVPDLATISMTTTVTCTFIYTYSCQLVKGNDAHKCKFNPVRDSTTIPNPIHSQSVGEGAIQQMSHTWVEKGVAAGTYTCKVQYNAAIGTSSTTFAAQHFVVTAVPE